MADIKSLDRVARKWSDVTPARASEYEAGVRAPKRDWSQATAEAADSYAQGVQEAISAGRFGKGVQQAGTGAWREGALSKGVSRWPQGVRVSTGKYQQGFAPFHAAISSTTLPPRGPKGDPRNYERVRVIGEALHNAKTG